jgi:hypothetical protein
MRRGGESSEVAEVRRLISGFRHSQAVFVAVQLQLVCCRGSTPVARGGGTRWTRHRVLGRMPGGQACYEEVARERRS